MSQGGLRMPRLILYRGIAVPTNEAEQIKQKILRDGIQGDEGRQWQFWGDDLRPKIETLLQKPDLSTADTRPPRESREQFRVVCACGDEFSASYYALRHNRHFKSEEVSYVIQFTVPETWVYVDGRDFVYVCFQLWDRESSAFRDSQRRALVKVFGSQLGTYFDKTVASSKQEYRIAMCDLACHDRKVLRAHRRNRIVLGGRHGTVFRSAFFVRAPITPAQVLAVKLAESGDFRPELTLADFLAGKLYAGSLPGPFRKTK
jgi:hypothetical protein